MLDTARVEHYKALLTQNPKLCVSPRLTKYILRKPFPKQHAAMLLSHIREIFYGGAGGGGKALKTKELVATPFGFKTIGTLKRGDVITGSDGGTQEVLGVFPQGIRPFLRFTFDDHTFLDCDEDHLFPWRWVEKRPKTQGYKVDLAKHVYERFKTGKKVSSVCLKAPVTFTRARKHLLPVDPYVLGLLLGDGSFRPKTAITFTKQAPQLHDELQKHYDWKIADANHGTLITYDKGLREAIRKLGLTGRLSSEKFIPKCYLTTSVAERLALLQGLIDTGGYVTKENKSKVEYSTSSKRLAHSAASLIRSLGGTCSVSSKIPGYTHKGQKLKGLRAYCLRFTLPRIGAVTNLEACRLERKKKRLQLPQHEGFKTIVDVRPIGNFDATCIKVSNPDGLFVAGKFYTLTHNSEWLLMEALQYVDIPGYSALLLRNTFGQLNMPKSILHRAHEWLRGTDARWHPKDMRYSFPSGAILQFGYCQHDGDVYNYDGPEYQFIGWDELTSFSEFQYTHLFARLRRLLSTDVPLRVRSASNPGNTGHQWVKNRMILDQNQDRVFIPAHLSDNPFIDAKSYLQSLGELDPVVRAQRKDGDWDIVAEGKIFKPQWFQKFVNRNTIPRGLESVRFWDIAATAGGGDWTAGVRLDYDTSTGLIYVMDVVHVQVEPAGGEAIIQSTAKLDGIGTRQRWEQEPGSAGVALTHRYRKLLMGYDCDGIPSTKAKIIRWRPFAAQTSGGNVVLAESAWNQRFIQELCAADGSEKVHDDQVDGAAGAYNELSVKNNMYIGAIRV